MSTPALEFPPSIDSRVFDCDYCGLRRPVAHVQIASATDTWLLCRPCIVADHTDDEVRAAIATRSVRQDEPPTSPEIAPPPVPEPFVFTRAYAIERILANWNQEEIDDRQCERLCAGVHTGIYDQWEIWCRAITGARLRHAARWHRALGSWNALRKHRSGLSHHDLWQDAESTRYSRRWLDPLALRILIDTLTRTIAEDRNAPCWRRRQTTKRLDLLKRRYRWLTGHEWQPFVSAVAS